MPHSPIVSGERGEEKRLSRMTSSLSLEIEGNLHETSLSLFEFDSAFFLAFDRRDEGKSGSHSLEKRRRTKSKWEEMESALESTEREPRARSRLELFSDVSVGRKKMWREKREKKKINH